MKAKVDAFLNKYGMLIKFSELEENCNLFIEDMNKGLDTIGSSLMMIPTYLTIDGEIPLNKPIIVIDAGGTNFRVAVIYFNNYKVPIIEDFKVYSMPGTNSEISKEEFFDTMVRYIEPVLNKSDKISLCFSYPTTIEQNKDGRLIEFCKEVQVKDVKGELIGLNLLKAIKKRGYDKKMSIILLNDTVATLLGGRVSFPDRIFESYIGFILGTGTNTCYIEKNTNIKKISKQVVTNDSMIINIESGCYKNFPRGEIDTEFDKSTVNPNDHELEKAISGAYLGGLILSCAKKASKEGIFSEEFSRRIANVENLSTMETDEFLNNPYSENLLALCCEGEDSEQDRLTLFYIIDSIVERAAMIAVFSLTAIIEKTGKGTVPLKPVCITADGSTFYKSKLFRNKLDYYIRTFTNEKKNLFCEFVKVENVTLIGTAIAGLLN